MSEGIRDQRQMSGVMPVETPEQVEQFWEGYAERMRAAAKPAYRLTKSRKRPRAYVSAGRWVADCPECSGGIAAWAEHPRGCCLDCGTIYTLRFPSEEERRDAEKVLMARPDDATRSWFCHQGETVADLKGENLIRGERLGPEDETLMPPDRIHTEPES